VPFVLASQPGIAMVNCHGSLSVIDGGAVSFGASSTEPAPARPISANTAAAKKSNRILMRPILCSPTVETNKILLRD
jgi:hypothetical protein